MDRAKGVISRCQYVGGVVSSEGRESPEGSAYSRGSSPSARAKRGLDKSARVASRPSFFRPSPRRQSREPLNFPVAVPRFRVRHERRADSGNEKRAAREGTDKQQRPDRKTTSQPASQSAAILFTLNYSRVRSRNVVYENIVRRDASWRHRDGRNCAESQFSPRSKNGMLREGNRDRFADPEYFIETARSS